MLVLTPGEPAGIGLDITLDYFMRPRDTGVLVVSDVDHLRARARVLGLGMRFKTFEPGQALTLAAAEMPVLHTSFSGGQKAGELDAANVSGLLSALDRSIAGCLNGEYQGLVTGPMQKSIVNDAGIPFRGHTEYLAQKSGVADVVMMLANRKMRVALATTHLPLHAVPANLTVERLERRLRILFAELKHRFGINQPRVLVAGLNPHAGEGGHLGQEEVSVIGPVCARLRQEGLDVSDPLPADTLFTKRYLAQCDAVMAMYHDQGLPVLKYSGFGEAVNITLGLPFVRTSVDHGTALDIAGTGEADASSLIAAIAAARDMTTRESP
jgi:4-hydroxythreonine-4-phosphate dehydrogenase